MPIAHIVGRVVVDYAPDGSVRNVHIQGTTPLKYPDDTDAPPQTFAIDVDSGTFGIAFALVAPTLDSLTVALAQYNTLTQLALDHVVVVHPDNAPVL